MQFDHIYEFQVFVLSMDDPRFIAKVIKQSKQGRVAIVMSSEWASIGWADQWIPKAMCHNENIVWIHPMFDNTYYDELRERKGLNFQPFPKGLELTPVVYFTCSILKHTNTAVNKLFAFMNNKPRYHRSQLIDNLFHEGLFDYGHITWRPDISKTVANYTPDEDYTKDRTVFNPIKEYVFKHWNPTSMIWPDELQRWSKFLQDNRTGFPDQTIPEQVHDSFLVLQAETDMDIPNLTEKTYKCLHWKKPFIILGPRGLHAYLEAQDYKLPEVIDYSFDDEPDTSKRIQMITQELIRLSKIDLNKMNDQVQDVVEHNYYVFMENLKACDDRLRFSEINQTTPPDYIWNAMVQNIGNE